jgi:hypothetical protein
MRRSITACLPVAAPISQWILCFARAWRRTWQWRGEAGRSSGQVVGRPRRTASPRGLVSARRAAQMSWSAYEAGLWRRGCGSATRPSRPGGRRRAWRLPSRSRVQLNDRRGLRLTCFVKKPVYRSVAGHTPDAAVILPSCSIVVPGEHRSRSAQPAPPDDQGTGSAGMAMRGRLWPPLPRRSCDAALYKFTGLF